MKSLCLEINNNTENTINNDVVNLNYNSDLLYNTLCDAKNGKRDAILFFIEKYKLLIKKYAFRYNLKNYDNDDLIQIGNISVITAINKYDLTKGNNYIDAYIINSIKNTFKNLARSQIKYKDESSLNIQVDENTEIEELISDSFNLESYIIDSMDYELLKSILSTLSPDEYELIRIAYFIPDTNLYRYCCEHNWNYPKKRRELISLLSKIKKLMKY